MKRFMTISNFLGVLCLAALCAKQWKTEGEVRHSLADQQTIDREQSTKIETDEQTLKQNSDDLEDLRSRLSTAETDLKDSRKKLTAATTQRDEATARNVQIRHAMDQWISAVAGRDTALRNASQQIQKLMSDRNDVVKRFNDLVAKYNSMAEGKS